MMQKNAEHEALSDNKEATSGPQPTILGSAEAIAHSPGFEDLPSRIVPTTRFDLRVLQSLRRIIRAVDLHSRKLSAQHNITGPQLVCLLTISDHEPITPSSIADSIHLSRSTVIGILDRLEAKSLVSRTRDLKDRRLVRVSLSDEGRALVLSAPSPLQDTFADGMNELPEAEQELISASLDRVVEMMEAKNLDAAPILQTGRIEAAVDTAVVDRRRELDG